jgi:hypothetical protein
MGVLSATVVFTVMSTLRYSMVGRVQDRGDTANRQATLRICLMIVMMSLTRLLTKHASKTPRTSSSVTRATLAARAR